MHFDGYWREFIKELKSKESLNEQIEFTTEEKTKFARGNSGDDAELITKQHDAIIKKLLTSLAQSPKIYPKLKKPQLTMPQIALIYSYSRLAITRKNADDIAAKNGFISITSGEALFQDYIKYSSRANRRGKPALCTYKKLMNKVRLFESILNELSKEEQYQAIEDITKLKNIIEKEYNEYL